LEGIQRMLVTAVQKLDEDKVVRLFELGLKEGISPVILIEEVRKGMDKVGEMYQHGSYYIADLIMAALIFKHVLSLVPLPDPGNGRMAHIVIGTVEEDIHDIGKNVTAGLLRSMGINVCDLGVDVKPETFVAALKDTQAKILGLSGLLTSSYDAMKRTVMAVEAAGLRDRIKIIIGGLVNDDIKEYVGADYWAKDCADGVDLCDFLITGAGQAAFHCQ